MKDRNRFPVGAWQVLHPSAGMARPFSGSFNECVAFEIRFRKSNPSICERENLPLDQAAIEDWVDEQNALRMIAGGWFQFVEEAQNFPMQQSGQKKSWLGTLRVVEGVKLIVDWLGQNKKPVPLASAEDRAAVCVNCPLNTGGDWKSFFTEQASRKIARLLGIKHDLNLATSYDSKLQICQGCECVLTLKVWTPFDLILENTSEDVWKSLDRRCWMLAERDKAQASVLSTKQG